MRVTERRFSIDGPRPADFGVSDREIRSYVADNRSDGAAIVFGEILFGLAVYLAASRILGLKEYAFLRDILAARMKGR